MITVAGSLSGASAHHTAIRAWDASPRGPRSWKNTKVLVVLSTQTAQASQAFEVPGYYALGRESGWAELQGDRAPPPPRFGIFRVYEANFTLILVLLVMRWGDVMADLELEVMLLLAAGIEPLRLTCHNTRPHPPNPKTSLPLSNSPCKVSAWKSA